MKLDELEESTLRDAVIRLRRIEGQVGGLIRMIESGRECRDVIRQVSAASRALDQVGFGLLGSALRRCVREADTEASRDTERELEKLFLQLA